MALLLEISLANILILTRLPYVFILNGEDEYWKPITLWHLSTAVTIGIYFSFYLKSAVCFTFSHNAQYCINPEACRKGT